jgi:hypothetical protein
MPICRLSAFPVPGRVPGLWALALALLASGCTTADIDKIPHEIGGLPAGAPARPAVAPTYPAVHDMPPQRAQSLLDSEQQEKLEKDLTALRNRQSKGAGAAKSAAKAPSGARPAAPKAAAKRSAKRSARQAPPAAKAAPATAGQAATGAPPSTQAWPQPTGAAPRP